MVDLGDPAVLAAAVAGAVGLLLKIADMASAARARRDAALDRCAKAQLDAQAEAALQNGRRIAAEKREDEERDARRLAEALAYTRGRELERLKRQVADLEVINAELEMASRIAGRQARKIGRWTEDLAARERVADERAVDTGHAACDAEAARMAARKNELLEKIHELKKQIREMGGRATAEMEPLGAEELGGGGDD